MKKQYTYSKITALIFCIIFFSGCGSDSRIDCAEINANKQSVIDSFSVALTSLDDSETFASTENSWLYLTTNTYIASAGIVQPLIQEKTKPLFSLFQNAYATTCVSPPIEEKIVNLNISSNADYNNEFLSGSSLNALFYSELDVTLEENLYNNEIYPQHGIDLFIKEMPTLDKNHVFTIEIELDDGSQYTVQSSTIAFQ